MATLDFFRNPTVQEPDYFDEGPKTSRTKVTNKNRLETGVNGMDTSAIDGWRQGVELTQTKHFDAGFVKIHAGEPGHVLRKNRVGEDRQFVRSEPSFADIEPFDPVRFIKAEGNVTYPIVIGDNDIVDTHIHDGIIEPLTIRASVGFYSLDVPFESHAIKGQLMGGNTDSSLASDRVVTVDYFVPEPNTIEFLDLVDMYQSKTPLNGYFRWDHVRIKPYNDSLIDHTYPEEANPPTIYSNPGTYPTGFVGTESMTVASLETSKNYTLIASKFSTVNFTAGDQTQQQVISRINLALGYEAAYDAGNGVIGIKGAYAGWLTYVGIVSSTAPQVGFISTSSNAWPRGTGKWNNDMVNALLPMSASTDNYVATNQRSSTSGWDYDTTAAIGTDSIAFGGMTY